MYSPQVDSAKIETKRSGQTCPDDALSGPFRQTIPWSNNLLAQSIQVTWQELRRRFSHAMRDDGFDWPFEIRISKECCHVQQGLLHLHPSYPWGNVHHPARLRIPPVCVRASNSTRFQLEHRHPVPRSELYLWALPWLGAEIEPCEATRWQLLKGVKA